MKKFLFRWRKEKKMILLNFDSIEFTDNENDENEEYKDKEETIFDKQSH